MVIVVLLVSARRRPTEHRAHHDRDGRPATKCATNRPATKGPLTHFRAAASHPPHGLPVATF